MEPRIVFLILFLLIVSFGPDQQTLRRSASDIEEIERWSQQLLGILRNTSYGDFNPSNGRWLNLTGFRKDDGYQWRLLENVQSLSRRQFQDVVGDLETQNLPLYRNPTGDVRGEFLTVKTGHGLRPNLTAITAQHDFWDQDFQRNVTETGGEISIDLVISPGKDEAVSQAKANIHLYTDSAPSTGWDMTVVGVHVIERGVTVMTTISDKFNAGFALPHFMLDKTDYNVSKPAIDSMMTEAVRKIRDGELSTGQSGMFAVPSCEYIVWLQQRPMMNGSQNASTKAIQQLEDEFEHPQGAPVIEPFVMDFSVMMFSPDCGIILESEVSGPRAEVYWWTARKLLIALIVVVAMEIALLKRQMEAATTPSTRSRISYQTIAIMAMGDGLLFSACIYFLIADDNLWLMVAVAAFAKCLNVAFLEVKFLYDLWTIQVGLPAEHEWERAQATNVPTALPIIVPTGLPLPVTAPRSTETGATPVILPPDQDVGPATEVRPTPAVSFAAVYSRFYFTMVMLMFISMWAMTWPRPLRYAYANTFAFLYLSFWVPQIYRNAMRNCRKAFSWEYVIGISILRTGTIVYWYLNPRNLLAIDGNPTTAYALTFWVWLQILVLASQQFLGPRLFIQDKWCPPAYDYHPVLREDEEEAGLPIGQIVSASEGKDKDDNKQNRKIFDCAICMNEIDVPVVPKGDGKGSIWLEQRNYMVTPCRHIFHTECLEGWMDLRLVCPICREGLPPL